MLAAMFVLMAACWMYSIAIVLVRVRLIIKERERDAPWLVEEAAVA
jgi:heme exporter protein C